MSDMQETIVVTGVGVISPYGAGLASLQAGMLSGKCCLVPAKDMYPGFEGTTAQVCGLLFLAEGSSSRYSRTDRIAAAAAQDAVADLDRNSLAFRESGVVMASITALTMECVTWMNSMENGPI